MIDTVLFDLGGTLVDYYTRAEFPALLGRCIAKVRDALRGRRLPVENRETGIENRNG